MSYEIQSVSEWLADQIYDDYCGKKTMSYDGFQVVVVLREMFEIYDRCEGVYHSEENGWTPFKPREITGM